MAKIGDMDKIMNSVMKNQGILDAVEHMSKLGYIHNLHVPAYLYEPGFQASLQNAMSSLPAINQALEQRPMSSSFAAQPYLNGPLTTQDISYIMSQVPLAMELNKAEQIASNWTMSIPAGLGKFDGLYQTLAQIPPSPTAQIFETVFAEQQAFYDRYRAACVKALYDAGWCPFIYDDSPYSAVIGLNEILIHTKPDTKSRRQKIDRLVFDYFDDGYIKWLKQNWKDDSASVRLKRTLRHVLEAYMKKDYGIPVVVLSTLWEGLIKDIDELQDKPGSKKLKESVHNLVTKNEYPEALAEFYDNLVMYRCEKQGDVKDDAPGRHFVAHGLWYKNYPTKKAALNAILFTEFLFELKRQCLRN